MKSVALGITIDLALLCRRDQEGVHGSLAAVKLRAANATTGLFETVEMCDYVGSDQDQLEPW